MKGLAKAICVAGLCTAYSQAYGATVSLNNTISSPDYFNGFEGATYNDYNSATYTEGNITVTQFNGDVSSYPGGMEGTKSWYSKDFGYTKISLANGDDFGDIGFLAGVGRTWWLAAMTIF
jgi:hypothetical protein